ncbi:hypothetical protein [Saccharothrix sp. ALI-22-I]|uniref:hypothetical protein n=1 Tax=Saccharothrix sp. ALI-22-I TaxID=1933778 RepID=UPI0015C2FFC7|nr:hypothetical protein [Saccharothrix sp. ALI-22-I]
MSENEYRDAIEAFRSCVRDAGYPVGEPVLSPVDGLTLLYDIPPTGEPDAWNRKVEECNLAHVSHIEPAYVEAREQTMVPTLRDAAVECLRDKGFTPKGTERNVKELVDSTGETANVAMECVTNSLRRLFPQVPGFLKIRW